MRSITQVRALPKSSVRAAFAFQVAARTPARKQDRRESLIRSEKLLRMMTVILTIVLLLWLIGVLTAYTLGGLIHLLLLLALIVLLIDILDRRRVL